MNKTKFASLISGSNLPHALRFAGVMEHADSFMIFGGKDDDAGSNSDRILKYNKDGGQWVEVPTALSVARISPTAIKVKSSFFDDICSK